MAGCPSISTALELWVDTCTMQQLPNDAIETWWGIILEEMQMPHRHWHGVRRLEELAKLFRWCQPEFRRPHAVAFALFFQNLVFDPLDGENELKSAKQFQTFSRTYEENIAKEDSDEAYLMILRSKPFAPIAKGMPNDFLLYLDMLNFVYGAHRDMYVEYMHGVERETEERLGSRHRYCQWRHHRLVKAAMANPLYHTEKFRLKFDQKAKTNIRWEISLLKAPLLKSLRLTISERLEMMQFEAAHRPQSLLAMTEDQMRHALAMGLDLCFATRDSATDEILAAVVGTITNEDTYNMTARTEHEFSGCHLLLHLVLTHEDYRHCGVMTTLLREYLRNIHKVKDHIDKISLLCPIRAIPFFARFGFKEIRRVKVCGPTKPIEEILRSPVEPDTPSAGESAGDPLNLTFDTTSGVRRLSADATDTDLVFTSIPASPSALLSQQSGSTGVSPVGRTTPDRGGKMVFSPAALRLREAISPTSRTRSVSPFSPSSKASPTSRGGTRGKRGTTPLPEFEQCAEMSLDAHTIGEL